MCDLCRIVPCSDVKEVSFYDNNQIRRVEFYRRDVIDDITPQSLGALSAEIDARWQTIMEFVNAKRLESPPD